MKIHKAHFTARQLALIPQIFQSIGVLLMGFGMISQERWTAISGFIISLITFWLAGQQGAANDANTAALQSAVGATPDAKPGPQSIQAALDLAKIAARKTPLILACACMLTLVACASFHIPIGTDEKYGSVDVTARYNPPPSLSAWADVPKALPLPASFTKPSFKEVLR